MWVVHLCYKTFFKYLSYCFIWYYLHLRRNFKPANDLQGYSKILIEWWLFYYKIDARVELHQILEKCGSTVYRFSTPQLWMFKDVAGTVVLIILKVKFEQKLGMFCNMSNLQQVHKHSTSMYVCDFFYKHLSYYLVWYYLLMVLLQTWKGYTKIPLEWFHFYYKNHV